MKKSLTQALGFCAALLVTLAACKKDEVRAVLQPGASPTLTSSGNSFVLTQNNSANRAVIYTWTPVTFGYPAVVDYSLQFDVKGGDFSKPYVIDAGAKLADTLSVSDLNAAFQSKGLVSTSGTPTPAQMDVRVIASVGPAAPSVNSVATTFTATPYSFCAQPAKSQSWSIIGPGGVDWNTDVPMTYNCLSKTFTYSGQMNAGDFKFRYGADWTANLGGASSTGGPLTQDGPNLTITKAGSYTIVLTPGPLDPATKKSTGGSFTIK
ncbi:SusE domain-containing protein [Hymenobacter sp. BRD67]|uniref:SusE domain-containing protein n=1 Tax=Hymenobacter sp. BRD67 TaxID=2675877 RepID=UPI0015661B97|nr:SusE domain-containing protein [Hymenobacter sp. BRD67]QKG52010.1 SusE domain-containing protein [Hymenobacter sp. BRD67]